MPTLSAITHRFNQVISHHPHPINEQVIQQLIDQDYRGQITLSQIQYWCAEFQLSPIEFALKLLPIAACYALAPISHFYVGAVAVGQSGTFYFGANQEFNHTAIQQTVHAEQSAISHAWLAGEKYLTDIVVNYTPCGHCRQFMNELNSAKHLRIHLPHSQCNLLQHYLPDSFGPGDLNIERVLFDPQQHHYYTESEDLLMKAAVKSASQAYAPYSKATSAVALQVGEQIITGRYAENAAFNPSFLPLQSALNYRRLMGLGDVPVSRIVMAEKSAMLTHREITENLANTLLGLTLEYVSL